MIKSLRFMVLVGCCLIAQWGMAQSGGPQALAGDWHGMIAGKLPLVLHLRAEAGGGLTATLDSTTQGSMGLEGVNVKLDAAGVPKSTEVNSTEAAEDF